MLKTEERNPHSKHIDKASTEEMLSIMQRENINAVNAVGADLRLGSRKAHGGNAQVLQSHGKESRADLLPGGEAHIQLPGGGAGILVQSL